MIVRPKHIALSILLFLFSAFIYGVNWYWGNSEWRSFQLASLTFFMVFMIVNIYWEMRDFWQFRWYRTEMQDIISKNYQIPILWEPSSQIKKLGGKLWIHKDSTQKGPLIIFIYGFSDDQESISYLTIPIVIAGYDVFTFDTRGKKTSRKAGNKNHFLYIIQDVKEVITFIINQPEFQNREIILLGTSIGAIYAINNGIWCKNVKKIIAISAMSNFRNNFSPSTITFIGKWWYWLRYTLFGVNLKPSDEINTHLSPVLQIENYIKSNPNLKDDNIGETLSQKMTFIHAVDDPIVGIKNFYENRKITQLPINNWMITKKGGHLFRKYELSLLASVLEAIKKYENSN